MVKQKCEKHNGKYGGCSHFFSGNCRLLDSPNNKCVMVSGGQCFKCCKFLNSEKGQLLLEQFNKSRR
jgi:hypothetical protein